MAHVFLIMRVTIREVFSPCCSRVRVWCSNEDEYTAVLSRALESTDEELFDAVPNHILKLTAKFVPYGKFSFLLSHHIAINLPSTPVLLSLSFSSSLSSALRLGRSQRVQFLERRPYGYKKEGFLPRWYPRNITDDRLW